MLEAMLSSTSLGKHAGAKISSLGISFPREVKEGLNGIGGLKKIHCEGDYE